MKILPLARMSLFATLLLASATPTAAVAGDGVGTATLELENKATGRKITTELWFEPAGGWGRSDCVRPLALVGPVA